MINVLDRICADKRIEVVRSRKKRSFEETLIAAHEAPTPRGFMSRLFDAQRSGIALITEIKRASPSKGLIREDFNVKALSQAFEQGGATCLSVLTDNPYFQGEKDHLLTARNATSLPTMRKDFMLDPYQIAESRALGADCVLLIMSILRDEEAQQLFNLSRELGLDVLFEVHHEGELDRALNLGASLIGINNRDLNTFSVNLSVAEQLAPKIPKDCLVISESGIGSSQDIIRLMQVGIRCFLLGEVLMRQKDPELATRELMTTSIPNNK